MKETGKNRNVLIVLRDMKESPLLSRIQHNGNDRYIVASDDIRVHRFVERLSWVNDICFIERMESFYRVVDDVMRILDEVNQWLASLGDDKCGIPRELLFWISHCEGGMTTQRIQDLLLLIRSYLYILNGKSIEHIIILSSPKYYWEDAVFIHTARSKNIPIQEMYRFRHIRFLLKIRSQLKSAAYEPYYILKILQSKILSLTDKAKADHHADVIFQMFSSAEKHVGMVVPFMKSLEKRGYHPVAQCWTARRGAVKIRQEGLQADEIEKWVPVSDLWSTIYRIFRTWRRALAEKRRFITDSKLQYEGIFLGELLWCSVVHFVWAELGYRYRLRSALVKYFSRHQPAAIKLWGGTIFAEGIITLRCLNRNGKTSLFNYMLSAVGIKEPYSAYNEDKTELFLASSVSLKEMMERSGLASDHIVVVGQGRHDHIPGFKRDYNTVQSRIYLGIPDHFELYLLFDPNYIIRGYLSPQEQIRCICCLLDFAKDNPSVALMIKPHPAHHAGILEKIVKEYSLVNVFLVDKGMLPYHALNAADVVIYKFSTLGYEAMLFDKPGISVILDEEENFKIYKEGAEYVFSTDKLVSLLRRIVNDTDFRAQWTALRLAKQKDFLVQNFPVDSKPKADLAAEAIDRFIQEKVKDSRKTIHAE